ncbi:MAG TPA: MFS transporter [Gemmataceae bacterium]|nr:MFS transporter [Gemmataceae bacterium]
MDPIIRGPWWRELNRYHWFVFVVAAFGWLFDTMDQQLFNIARVPAIRSILTKELGHEPDSGTVQEYGGYATSVFLIGWGTGGLLFGVLGDLLGRVRSLMLTILLYSLFTGLSALSTSVLDFSVYRFLTGLGVGGEFAVGVSLVAEVMPDRARPFALGLLQALSAVGNVTAALVGILQGQLTKAGVLSSDHGWRGMFLVGTLPALLTLVIMRRLKEPERWQALAAKASAGERLRAYFSELFGNSRWSRNAVIGLMLAASGIIGLWGIGFFAIDLQRTVFRTQYGQLGLPAKEIDGMVSFWAGMTSLMMNIGAFFGIYAFSYVTHSLGRKLSFGIFFVLALLSTAFVFWFFHSTMDVFWMIPIMGFCQLALFGGYAIYFPELFPTRLRSTGTSFCYNGARFVAAAGPTTLGLLTNRVFAGYPEPMRYAGVTMCVIFVLGLIVLPFAPETKGQPLPE